MPDIILHHYPFSPFGEKVRLAFGLKGLAWRSVDTPPLPPRPLLAPLTGGYRRIPVVQIGADIYCDTGIILPALDRLAPEPTLYPLGGPGFDAAAAFGWERLIWKPMIGVMVHFIGDSIPPEFLKDRKEDYLYYDISKEAMAPELPVYVQAFRAQLAFLKTALSDGRRFILGDSLSALDLAYFHPIWLLYKNCPQAEAMLGLTPLLGWYERVLATGHGRPEPMSAEDALAVAREAEPAPANHLKPDGDLYGIEVGQAVTVTPEDNARVPVAGALVGADATEIVIHRRDVQAGDLHVHFPRAGFEVKPA